MKLQDLDAYKSHGRDSILSWLSGVRRSCGAATGDAMPDWAVVIVENADGRCESIKCSLFIDGCLELVSFKVQGQQAVAPHHRAGQAEGGRRREGAGQVSRLAR